MNTITKNNLKEFLEYYHNFHDSCITNINYSITSSEIEMLIDIGWSGKAKLKINRTYDTNPTKKKIIFENVKNFNNKEIFSWDFIKNIYLDFSYLEDGEYICFADDEDTPLIYIVAKNMKYEEIQ